jgi:glutathione S-transferase
MHLVIGNKLYSSWSLRPWLLMTALGVPFRETVIPLGRPETRAQILAHSPSGKVPCLIDGDVVVWETLAIVEYLAERQAGVWPADAGARAHARAIASEMHAGFAALRRACPMNLAKRFAWKERGPEAAADVARIEAIWRTARARFGAAGGGPFLFGAFSAADAMYAPVATRLDTYQVPVAPETRAYVEAILAHQAFRAWRRQALAEPWRIAHYEEGETAVEAFAPSPA